MKRLFEDVNGLGLFALGFPLFTTEAGECYNPPMKAVKRKVARKRIRWDLDKTAVSVVCKGSAEEDAAWWRTRSPNERFRHIEYLRQLNYGYDPATTRLQRILEVVECRPR